MFYKTEFNGFINMKFISNFYVEGVDFGAPVPILYVVVAILNGEKLILKYGFKIRKDAEDWIVLLLNNAKNKEDFEYEDLPA